MASRWPGIESRPGTGRPPAGPKEAATVVSLHEAAARRAQRSAPDQIHRPRLVLLQGGASRKSRTSHRREGSGLKVVASLRVVRENTASTTKPGVTTGEMERATRRLVQDLLLVGGPDDLLARRLSYLLSIGKQEAE